MNAEIGLELLGYGMFVALVVAGYLRCRNSQDEVVRAANVAAMAIGAPVGLGIAFVTLFAVRLVPDLQGWLAEFVRRDGAADVVSASFGLGILFTCLMVSVVVGVTWFGWWFSKR